MVVVSFNYRRLKVLCFVFVFREEGKRHSRSSKDYTVPVIGRSERQNILIGGAAKKISFQ